MTQEDKQLLLKVLCAMLPYGVKCADFKYDNNGNKIDTVEVLGIVNPYSQTYSYVGSIATHEISRIKPYLRPMSSMIEEELRDFAKIKFKNNSLWEIVEFPKKNSFKGFINVKCKNKNNGDTWIFQVDTRAPLGTYYGIDWLNAHHFDYRGLIEKGLALEAPDCRRGY